MPTYISTQIWQLLKANKSQKDLTSTNYFNFGLLCTVEDPIT